MVHDPAYGRFCHRACSSRHLPRCPKNYRDEFESPWSDIEYHQSVGRCGSLPHTTRLHLWRANAC
ncbi:Uncharacterised protein [Vibrio cholerae]|nr:Uncharacterised protein [Vibrio cholerae]